VLAHEKFLVYGNQVIGAVQLAQSITTQRLINLERQIKLVPQTEAYEALQLRIMALSECFGVQIPPSAFALYDYASLTL
jgi:hypothetical protein